MAVYLGNVNQLTINNDNYRDIIVTTQYFQMVTMSIDIGGSIPYELHQNTDQYITVIEGSALISDSNRSYEVRSGESILIPALTNHVVNNIENSKLKLLVIYTYPEHHHSEN